MKLFISKNEEEVPELALFCQTSGIHLLANSLIRFEDIDFDCPDKYDIVFFSSPRSVRYFLKRCQLREGIALACVGSGTAKEMTNLNLPISFQGIEADTSKVAVEFLKWCGQRNVLFPISDRSLKTIVHAFPENQRTTVVVYKTKMETKPVPASNTYVFTSPSNVEAYFESNPKPNQDAQFVAWGPSTERALKSFGIGNIQTLEVANEASLIRLLKSFIA